jgi:hypothetical protein
MRRALPFAVVAALLATLPLATACGGGSYPSAASPYRASATRTASVDLSEGEATGAAGGGYGGPAEEQALYAQLRTEATSAPASTPGAASTPPTTTDARDLSGPLLIYTATLHMAVFEVRATQAQLIERARAMGGLLFVQTDDRLVVRVPAARFDEYLAGVGELGDVLHRDVQAQDVGEEFRDVALRIRNLEVTRQRVEALLAQARNVEEALAVQRELERITTELEALRGRQRYLADRISLSTITFVFQPRPREALEQPEIFQLPFGWLEQLGLSNLLEVR